MAELCPSMKIPENFAEFGHVIDHKMDPEYLNTRGSMGVIVSNFLCLSEELWDQIGVYY